MRQTGSSKATTSIKTRASAVAVGLVLVTTFVLTALGQFFYQKERRARINDDLVQRVDTAAALLDQKFASRSILMRSFAQGIVDELHSDPAHAQKYLMGHDAIGTAFDGYAIIGASGTLVASYSNPASIGKVSVADRDYFKDTVRYGRGVVSAPLVNRMDRKPQIVMTQPVTAHDGRLTHIVAATLNLSGAGFFSEISRQRIGNTGYFFIMDKSGVLVEHPQQARLLKSAREAAAAPAVFDKALAGYEGGLEDVSASGQPALYAFRRMRETDWIVGAVLPEDEAFAPVYATHRDIFFGALVMALAAGALAWWAMRRQFTPLATLLEQMGAASRDPQYVTPPTEHRQDEIGEIGLAFEQLLRDRANAQRALVEREASTRSILANSVDAFVACDTQGRISEWNRRAEETFGWTHAEAIGRQLAEVLVPEAMRAAHYAGMRRFLETGEGPVLGRRIQMHALHRDGHEVPVEMAITAVRTAAGFTAAAFLRDTTEKLAAEALRAQSERRLRMIADHVPALIAYMDHELRYRFVNENYRARFGLDPRGMIGRTTREVFGEPTWQRLGARLEAALAGERVHFELHSSFGGRTGDLAIDYLPDVDERGKVIGVYIMAQDITERRESARKLAESETRLRTIADNLPVLISFIDTDLVFQFCNATYEKWFGLKPADILFHSMEEVFGAASFAERRAYVDRALAGETVEFEITSVTTFVGRHIQAVYIPAFDADGKVFGFYAIGVDNTRQKEIERELLQQAHFDSLTRLPNRAQLDDRLGAAVARHRRTGRPVGLLFIDIDHFKQINDSYGHATGDDVLREFARRLQECLRVSDVAARLAGDEFVVILEDLGSVGEMQAVCEKILRVMCAPWSIDGRTLQVSASIGAAFALERKPTPAELMAHADNALYRVKHSGRGSYMVETL